MEATASIVGSLISKPKMSEKHLSRPPLRFIHDVFTSVSCQFSLFNLSPHTCFFGSQLSAETGFGAGLLPEHLQDSSQVKGKEAKIEFLTLVVDLVNLQLNTQCEVSIRTCSLPCPDCGIPPRRHKSLKSLLGKRPI